MSSCWPDSGGTWDVLFWNVSSMKEPLAREPRWLPSGTLLHVGGFILSHLFSPRRFLIKSVPGVASVFFLFLMHFDSAEMRFLCGDIRCSRSKDTDGSWPSVRRAGKKNIEWYFENINECLHFSQSWVLAGPRRFTRRLSQIHFQRCFLLFF